MKLLLISAAALAAALLGGCTTYTAPSYSSYGTRVYSDRYDSGDYYSRGYRDGGGYYDGGVYHSGGYYEPQYHYRRQAERSGTVAVTERHDTVRASKSVSHGAVSHQASATVSHGHNGNKATVGSSTKPAKVPSAGKHPRSDKTSKSEKETEKKTE